MLHMASDHLTKVLIDSARSIAVELWERLEIDPSEKDVLAISTAVEKAIVTGARAGVAEAAAQVQEALPEAKVNLHQDIASTDEWAERYG